MIYDLNDKYVRKIIPSILKIVAIQFLWDSCYKKFHLGNYFYLISSIWYLLIVPTVYSVEALFLIHSALFSE